MIDDQSSSHHTLKGCDDDDVMIVTGRKEKCEHRLSERPLSLPPSLPNQRQQSGDVDEVQRGLVASLASTNVGGT